MINPLNLRRTKVKDDGQFAQRLNETFNDLIIQLRKEREKNRRLVAAIRKLVTRRTTPDITPASGAGA